MSIKIVLLEDHLSVAESFVAALKNYPEISVLSYHLFFESFLEFVGAHNDQIDVLVMDLDINGKLSFEIIHELKALFTHKPIYLLFLTGFATEINEIFAQSYEADGFMSKHASIENIVNAIKHVNTGKKLYEIDSQTASRSIHKIYIDIIKSLSVVEKQFITQIKTDASYSEIADTMQVQLRTVHGIRERLFEKFKVSNRSAFINKCLTYGIN